MKITLMMAITLDGKIAKSADHFPDWTGSADKKLFAEESKKRGVVIMGEKTFNTLPGPLKDRLNVVFTMDQSLHTREGVKWVKGEPEEVLKDLEKMGYQEALLGGGAYLNTLFLKKNLIDEIIITIAPKVFGSGLPLFNEAQERNLKLLEYKAIDDNTLMIKYKVIK